MNRLWFLMVYLLLGVSFLGFKVVPHDLHKFFPFSEQELTIQTYAYFLFEHVCLIMLTYVIYQESVKYRFALFVFFLIHVFDLIDYCLTYNSVYFQIGIIPISMNVLKVVIFMGAIAIEKNQDG